MLGAGRLLTLFSPFITTQKFFTKIIGKMFGGFRKKLYLCSINKEGEKSTRQEH